MNLIEQLALQAQFDAQIKASKKPIPADQEPAPKRRGRPRKAS